MGPVPSRCAVPLTPCAKYFRRPKQDATFSRLTPPPLACPAFAVR
jgi:hypothetical protein